MPEHRCWQGKQRTLESFLFTLQAHTSLIPDRHHCLITRTKLDCQAHHDCFAEAWLLYSA
eukprot:scaffold67099_cov20-Tisochrysis_lutea.AAC.1